MEVGTLRRDIARAGGGVYIAWTRESPSSGLPGGETGPKQLDRPSAQQDGPHGHHRHKPAGRAEIEDNDRHEGDEEGDQREGHILEVGIRLAPP
jgi:hypothetical protein